MSAKNAFYAQSGGVTSVINATAAAVIQTARAYPEKIKTLYAGKNGITGALDENLIDTSLESENAIAALMHTPGGAFGSCRYKLRKEEQFKRLFEVLDAHDIGYFFYNGGGDSQDTSNRVADYAKKIGFPLTCIGIPKTIDNDLPFTDNCPGFGSAAKYIATSIREASYDLESMCATSTNVFILEAMGRHAGWLAAASGLACDEHNPAPHIILFPEITFNQDAFIAKVKETKEKYGYCSIVTSEGIKTSDGDFLSQSNHVIDAFGHAQLGGVAPILANMIKHHLGYKYHWALPDYLQRSARHISSQTDFDQAVALGRAAVEFAVQGKNAVMPVIKRISSSPYQWEIDEAPLSDVANVEKKMPLNFISEDGFHITEQCREYLTPLIQGEATPPYKNGLPHYVRLKNQLINKKTS